MGDEELSVKGPGGVGFSFKGAQMFPVLLLFLLAAFLAYLVFQIDAKAENRQIVASKVVNEVKEGVDKVQDKVDKVEATMKVLVYVIALPQADREKLNLNKPRELQDMQR